MTSNKITFTWNQKLSNSFEKTISTLSVKELNTLDSSGNTALKYTMKHLSYENVTALLDMGVDPNVPSIKIINSNNKDSQFTKPTIFTLPTPFNPLTWVQLLDKYNFDFKECFLGNSLLSTYLSEFDGMPDDAIKFIYNAMGAPKEHFCANDNWLLSSYESGNLPLIDFFSANNFTLWDGAGYLSILNHENVDLQDFYQHHKNLVSPVPSKDIDANSSEKIPSLIHHIWLTSKTNPHQIASHDIENVKNSHNVLTKNNNTDIKHIVWTNDKSLIEESAQQLEDLGVKVENFQEIKGLKSGSTIESLIEQGKYGVASDLLRLDILSELGGVYFDLNFAIDRDFVFEQHSFDFFAHNNQHEASFPSSIHNNFIAAKPFHPIIVEAFDLVQRNLITPPKYVQSIMNSSNIMELNNPINYLPLSVAYFKYSNNFGNIDVIYCDQSKINPPPFDEAMCPDDSFYKLAEENQDSFCIYSNKPLGTDNLVGGGSWIPDIV